MSFLGGSAVGELEVVQSSTLDFHPAESRIYLLKVSGGQDDSGRDRVCEYQGASQGASASSALTCTNFVGEDRD